MLLQFAYLNSIPKNLFKQTNFPNLTEKRWRDDGKCGWNNTLTDDAIAECNPNESENKPCCSAEGRCVSAGNMESCYCSDCVDYRIVKKIRKSGESCIVTGLNTTIMGRNFLKNVCYDNTTKRQYFKCALSDVSYEVTIGETGELEGASKVCKSDPFVYQACGFSFKTQITNTEVFCGAYFCGQEKNGYHNLLECTGDGCRVENRDCNTSKEIGEIKVCDDKCDEDYCKDESFCNGHQYGVFCDVRWSMGGYVPVHHVCDGREDCNDGSDEQNCTVTDSTVYTCTHYRAERYFHNVHTVPINNYTRCSVFDVSRHAAYLHHEPYCMNYLDQTNCSDIERVGGYCEVNGYNSTVSKYMVCHDYDPLLNQSIQLCDDGFQNKCLYLTTASDCRVHKHWMCDGVKDCPDGTDEIHDMCKTMTKKQHFFCKRRFDKVKSEKTYGTGIPLSWILDNDTDCMDGEDENKTKWKLCSGEVKQLLLAGESCQNYYKCSHDVKSFVPFDQLCDEVESCGDETENTVCRVARDFPIININAHRTDHTTRDVCRDLDITKTCEIREFAVPWSPNEVFGVDRKILVNVPTSRVNCTDLYGENYLFLSCMELCSEKNATCPLKNNSKLRYNSCPGQFPDRAITLAENSFLTFVSESNRGIYHQEFYQCKNRRCIEYKQVCDLIDDCGDMSDEINCANHMICEDTKNSTRQHFISLEWQKCDGIYDCFDLSDECNDECGREILASSVLKIICWIMGLLAVLFNVITIANGVISLKQLKSKTSSLLVLYNKVLVCLIGYGDLLIGTYLIILSVYDSLIFGGKYCKNQAKWLTGTPCLVLGVISTIGSQISVFAMTALSIIRVVAVFRRSMTLPLRIDLKSCLNAGVIVFSIIATSLAVALIPLLPSFEDYFVQGMYYDPAYKVFIGFPNKRRHVYVLWEYYSTTNNVSKSIRADMPWTEIGKLVDGMFTADHGKLTKQPVHFYGNDGVCLFKYFVRTDDARKSRQSTADRSIQSDPVVWTMLAVNLACFIVMSLSYIALMIHRRASSVQSSGGNEKTKLQNKVTIILVTDFVCWVPFILISALHNLQFIDASSWYTFMAMTLLPFNSVLNPLIYDDHINELIKKGIRFVRDKTLELGDFIGKTWSTQASNQEEIESVELQVVQANT